MKNRYIIPLILLLLPSIALSQPKKGENLMFDIPSDYKLGADLSDAGFNFFEFVPEKEDVKSWSKMLTIQVYKGMPKKGFKGEDIQKLLSERILQTCQGSETKKIDGGLINSYDFQIWQAYCPLSHITNKKEFFLIKTIDGNDSIYVVQYAFSDEPSQKNIDEALAYLEHVTVCDTRIKEQNCKIDH